MSKNLQNNSTSYLDATGPIAVTLRNDMMFHRAMQGSNNALKGLVCALKGLDPDTVSEVVLTNTIDYSEYAHKEIILDVKVLLNNNEILDIELQLYEDRNWERRSLLYLCRSFDSIGESEDYSQLKPTSLIAIMDNPLFPEMPEFYSRYQLLNLRNHSAYSTLLNVNVLYLNQTDLATEEDINNNLVYWAELFKAKTWENLKDLCAYRPEFKEVVNIMYNVNVQDSERTLYEAHQRYLLEVRSAQADREEYENMKRNVEELKQQLAKREKQLLDAGIPLD